MPRIRIGSISEMPAPGQVAEFDAGGRLICVANIDGTISAMSNMCLHRGAPLGQGVVDDGNVVCNWHGWAWNPATGRCVHNPEVRIPIYPVRIEGEDVYVEL